MISNKIHAELTQKETGTKNSILFIDKIISNEIHAEILLSIYNRKLFYYIYLINRI